jgi:hypothetical protein
VDQPRYISVSSPECQTRLLIFRHCSVHSDSEPCVVYPVFELFLFLLLRKSSGTTNLPLSAPFRTPAASVTIWKTAERFVRRCAASVPNTRAVTYR